MDANLNSFTAKLYRWFYITDTMPENLCPYFWKCVVMYVSLIPCILVMFPGLIFDYIMTKKYPYYKKLENIWMRLFYGVGFWAILFFAVSTIFTAITIWTVDKETLDKYGLLYAFGLSVWLIVILFYLIKFLFFCISSIVEWVDRKQGRRRLKKLYKENGLNTDKFDSIVWSFIKAKYHKYCPKINWKQ